MTKEELITKVYALGFEISAYRPNESEVHLLIYKSDHELASVSLNVVGSLSLQPESPRLLDLAIVQFAKTPLDKR